MMPSHTRPFAIVTSASSGIGYELAKCCAEHGFDLLVAADQPSINDAAQDFHAFGVAVEAIEADLATLGRRGEQGVDDQIGTDPHAPVYASTARTHPERRDRSVVHHHPSAAARGRAPGLRDVQVQA